MNTQPTAPRRLLTQRSSAWVRGLALLSLIVVTPAGFGLKLYGGPGRHWANNYAAGVMYVVFWCLVALFLWPRPEWTIRLALAVLVITSALEVAQLWHAPVLEQVRETFLGRALLGTSFDWLDFPHYLAGSFIGWMWMRAVVGARKREPSRPEQLP